MAYATLESNLLFIVGLQKSGTSPLLRLLRSLEQVNDPFPLEGRRFWGDDPPFSPAAPPSGQFYSDANGHEIDAQHASEEVAAMLAARIASHLNRGGLVVNKNPYNSVRTGWLRALFPNARIVALFRSPCDNVYSLLKKFQPQDANGLPPEQGWWGVKPRGWQAMRDPSNLTAQLSAQWCAVNEALLAHADQIDAFVSFESFCAAPAQTVARMHPLLADLAGDAARITSLDAGSGEYLKGGLILSRNRLLGPQGGRYAPEPGERLRPLDAAEIEDCTSRCAPTLERLLERSGRLARSDVRHDSG